MALHGLATGEGAGGELFHGLGQLRFADRLGFHPLDFGEHGGAGGVVFVGFHDGAHAEQSRVAGAVGPGVDGVHETLFLANLLIEPRAASAAEQRGEHVENRNVRMAQFRDVPGEVEVAHFDRRLLGDFACGDLFRFRRQDGGRHRTGFAGGEGRADLFLDFGGIDVAHDDEEDVVRRVLLLVIGVEIFAADFVENIRIADDGETIRTLGVGGLEQATRGALMRVVLIHVHLAADDVHLLREVRLGQRRVLHDVAEDVDGDLPAGVGDVDPIDRAVERRVGVHVTTGLLHLLIDAVGGASCGALEEHVLETMGEPGSEPSSLIDAARLAPGLGGDDGRAVILADDQREADWQCAEADAGRNRGRGDKGLGTGVGR